MPGELGSDVMDAEETRQDAAGELSTNATAFCIASLLGDGDDGPLTTGQDPGTSDSAADSDDDDSETKITSRLKCLTVLR